MSAPIAIQMDSIVARDDKIFFHTADDEAVMMSLERGEYYHTNPVGTRLWGLLETPKKVSDLCELLLLDYKVTPEQCAQEVLLFLNQLAEKGIIKLVSK